MGFDFSSLPSDLALLRSPSQGQLDVAPGSTASIPTDYFGILASGAGFVPLPPGNHSLPPGPAAMFLINVRAFSEFRWGTKAPVTIQDPDLKSPVPVRARGSIVLRVDNPAATFQALVGADGRLSTADANDLVNTRFVSSALADALAGFSFARLSKNPAALADPLSEALRSRLGAAGLTVMELKVDAVDTTDDVKRAIAVKEAGPSGEKRREFVCPQCGQDALFTPGEGLKCPACGHRRGIAQTAEQVREFSFQDYLKNRPPAQLPAGQKGIKCKQCGAESTVPADAASMNCAFCGRAMVLEAVALPAQLQPEGIVPFQISKEKCAELFRAWIKSRWFAPNSLRNLAAQDKIGGVYRPYWTYDSHTDSWYTGERGDYYYVNEEYTDSQGKRQTRRVRKTRWTNASGRVNRFFDDVLVSAGRPTEWSTNYDLQRVQPYAPEFLSGWSAERYTTAPEKGWETAQGVMDAQIHQDVRRDIGGDEQRVHHIKTAYNAVRFKHILLPLYLSAYLYAGKPYRIQINGQSGDVRGQRPYSFWKIFFLVLAIAGVIAGIVLVVKLADRSTSELHPDHQEEAAEAEVELERVVPFVLDVDDRELVAQAEHDVLDRKEGRLRGALDVVPADVAVLAADSHELHLQAEPRRKLADEPGAEHGKRPFDVAGFPHAELV